MVELPILGVTLRFESADREIISAVVAEYGAWRALAAWPELCQRTDPLPLIQLALRDTPVQASNPLRVTVRVNPTSVRLCVRGTQARAIADTALNRGLAVLAPGLLLDPDLLRAALLDTLVLALITRLDRTPLHASAIADSRAALALTGPSGSGKSTLARLAQQAGYSILADEAVYLQTKPSFHLWGMARTPRPRAADSLNNKAGAPGPSNFSPNDLPVRERAGICLLRRDGAVGLEPITPAECAREVLGALEPGFDLFREKLELPLLRLAAGGAWLLHLPPRPEAAMPFLNDALNSLRSVPPPL